MENPGRLGGTPRPPREIAENACRSASAEEDEGFLDQLSQVGRAGSRRWWGRASGNVVGAAAAQKAGNTGRISGRELLLPARDRAILEFLYAAGLTRERVDGTEVGWTLDQTDQISFGCAWKRATRAHSAV